MLISIQPGYFIFKMKIFPDSRSEPKTSRLSDQHTIHYIKLSCESELRVFKVVLNKAYPIICQLAQDL